MVVMEYPRPITSIHQIEISSRCNLRCVYCPSPKLHQPVEKGGSARAKEDISTANFCRALAWASHFDELGTQHELALTGIGEALLHPHFVEFLRLSREALPENRITFSTNGILLTETLCEQIAPYRPEVYISLHRPEKAKPAIDIAHRFGLLKAVNASFATLAFDWAGQLDWPSQIPPNSMVCEFLRTGWAVVFADGRITTCCLDAMGGGVVGHVDDEIGSLGIQPWQTTGQDGRVIGCASCHLEVP